MRSRLTLAAALALSLAVGACSEDAPTGANTAPEGQQTGPEFARQKSDLLKNRAVTGTIVEDGRAVTGTITITKFNYTEAGGLTVDGLLNYTVETGESDAQEFTGVRVQSLERQGSPSAPVCDILILDIGAISLDLLGLTVDIAPISIDVRGETGPGNLLGNLLCALAGLLDPGPGPLAAIIQLLNQINNLLAGILG